VIALLGYVCLFAGLWLPKAVVSLKYGSPRFLWVIWHICMCLIVPLALVGGAVSVAGIAKRNGFLAGQFGLILATGLLFLGLTVTVLRLVPFA